ncbi:MAG: VWA domain-containing protein [Oleiphilaceae bacterium]|nr:VWA domain-containing protein [Oleiphilaceae bacterium]
MDWWQLISQIEWSWPWAVVLLPLPWLAKWGTNAITTPEPGPQLPVMYQALHSIGVSNSTNTQRPSRTRIALLAMAWLLLVLAMMRPHHVGPSVNLPLSGRDLMLAIDISPSMKERDMLLKGVESTRLEAVKYVVSDFVERRQGDRVGLVLFGSQPYLQAPLTFDLKTVNTLLQEAFLGMAGQATAIGDAITLATKRLRQRPEQSRVLILLSDGQNTAGEIPPEKAAQFAAHEGITIYTIGIGAEEIIKRSFFGVQRVNPSADLDEAMLKQIASSTGGKYYRARDLEELQQIYQEIDALEPIEQEQRSFRPRKALSYWLIGAAIGLWLSTLLLQGLLTRGQTLITNRFGLGGSGHE